MTPIQEFLENLKQAPRHIRESAMRNGKAPETDRERSQSTFHNLFLHMQSVRTDRRSLRFAYTFGLGLILTASFVVLTITGILLMVYYKPGVELAYNSVKDIHFVVPAGRFIRNIHRWSAHLMVLAVFLHMARVFYTGSYKRPREFNWLIGLALLVFTLGLSFTGYLLPWDQLAYWAVTIGANIASSPREVTDAIGITAWFDPGGFQKQLLLGANYVGQESSHPLLRASRRCAAAIDLRVHGAAFLAGAQGWRPLAGRIETGAAGTHRRPRCRSVRSHQNVRPNGGSTRPDSRGGAVAGRIGIELAKPDVGRTGGLHVHHCSDAGAELLLRCALKEMANPAIPENPAKAPWYFLGLQELVSYSAFMGGVGIPSIVLIGLGLIPYLDRDPRGVGIWFGGPAGRRTFWQSLVYGLTSVLALLAVTVNFGWLRTWFPTIPQIAIIILNPATVIVAMFSAWSLWVLRRTGSIRMSAVALFTCFLAGFVVLTAMGSIFRGPNWHFYWWPSQWPTH